jgi:hypothetical protein
MNPNPTLIMPPEPNPFLHRMDQIQDAKKSWADSEWLLNFLRTETDQTPQTPTHQELLLWAQKLH